MKGQPFAHALVHTKHTHARTRARAHTHTHTQTHMNTKMHTHTHTHLRQGPPFADALGNVACIGELRRTKEFIPYTLRPIFDLKQLSEQRQTKELICIRTYTLRPFSTQSSLARSGVCMNFFDCLWALFGNRAAGHVTDM